MRYGREQGRRRLARAVRRLAVAAGVVAATAGWSYAAAAQELAWARAVGGAATESPQAIAVAPDGSVYTVGYFQGVADFDPGPGVYELTPQGGQAGYVSKVDPAGAFAWAFAIDSPQADQASDVAVDAAGNVYVTGTFRQTVDFDPGPGVFTLTTSGSNPFVLKVDADGGFLWARHLDAPFTSAFGRGIAVDGDHAVYLTGWFWGTLDLDPGAGVYALTAQASFPDSDAYLVKLDAAGDFVWGGQLGGSGADVDPERIAVDSAGRAVAVGSFTGAVDLDPGSGSELHDAGSDRYGYAVRLDAAGDLAWATSLGGGVSNAVLDAAFGAGDELALAGYFWGTVDFDPGPGVDQRVSGGAQDLFVWRLSGAGEHRWVRHVAHTGTQVARGVELDRFGNAYAIGNFRSTVDFDPGPGTFHLTSAGNSEDTYLLKLDAQGGFGWAVRFGGAQQVDGIDVTTDSAGDVYATGVLRDTVDFDPGPGTFELTAAGFGDDYAVKLDQPEVACDLHEIRKLTASDGALFDVFGFRADLDGDLAIAGTKPESDPPAPGAAYVFERHAGGADNWGEVAILTASDQADGDAFGYPVAISGTTAIVGAPKADGAAPGSGAAYLFSGESGAWQEVKKIFDSETDPQLTNGDFFGYEVAIDGDVAAVTTAVTTSVTAGGAVVIFERDAGGPGNWGLVKRIEAFDPQLGDGFGFDLALDGGILAVGSKGDDDLGSSSGSVYLYGRDQGGPSNWGLITKLTADDGAADDAFGHAVDLRGDLLAVGAWLHAGADVDSGAVYLFERHAGGPDAWGLVAERVGSATVSGDAFGWGVAVTDGAVVVGAPAANGHGGEIYVFERDAGGLGHWGETRRYSSPNAVAASSFGAELQSDGERILVGAYADGELGFRAGAAYVVECVPAGSVVDADGDGFDESVDCNDADPAVHPGATEACNGADDDCDGEVDEGHDGDGDGTADCFDGCPADGAKTAPGVCGCGAPESDGDGDGTLDCQDLCPADPGKIEPGACGCGVVDADTDGDGTPDCQDLCPADPSKLQPGACGCGVPDLDTDDDGTFDCSDECPADPAKDAPGICGCGVSDADTDGDGLADCLDACPADPGKIEPGACGCGVPDADGDGDGTPDCLDACPADPGKVEPGACGCGVSDADTDGDGTPDCLDGCAADPGKVEPGVCGCGISDADTDGDGTADCEDACPVSDLLPTVVIDGCDSGVANALLAGACTLADLALACVDEAANHGQYVSCVSHRMNDLKKEGVIDGAEKGSIVDCAAQSSLP